VKQRFRKDDVDWVFKEMARVESRLEGPEVFSRRELLDAAEAMGERHLFVDFRPPRGRMLTVGPVNARPEFLTCDEVVAAAREAGFQEGTIELAMARTGYDDES
jgi:hypothetical protein